jgi:23S rRNA (uracil1939-C5)-methyltransferase
VIRAIRARIERLAPTGEGIAHDRGKVVFVDSALPGELVDAEVFEEKARHARAAATAVIEASPVRREADGHAAACGGTDWAHLRLEPARAAKRELFLETMRRIGHVDPALLGELPIAGSGLEYRLRNQFHVGRTAGEARAGFFAKRSHRIVPLEGCEIVSAQTRAAIAGLCAEGALPDGRIETLETVETERGHALAIADQEGRPIAGSPRTIDGHVDTRPFRVSVGSFFQVNRHRIAGLFDVVREAVAASGAQTALDAYAGAGFLSRAMVEGGARVTAVEASPASSADAEVNRSRLGSDGRLDLVASRVEDFLARRPSSFDVVVVDPPREGLKTTAEPLAALARRQLIYVSCEPASLARDLGSILAQGFRIESARLEDFFPLTHRVEAVVVLRRD